MEGQPRVRNEWRGSTRGVGVRTRQATAAGQRPGKRRANTSGADSRASEPPGLSQVVYRRATRSTVVLLRCHRRRYVVVVLVQWQRAVVLLRVDRQRSNIERIANKIPAKERNRPSTCHCRLFFSFFCFLSHTREKQEEVWGETQVDHIPEDTSLLKEFPLSLSLSFLGAFYRSPSSHRNTPLWVSANDPQQHTDCSVTTMLAQIQVRPVVSCYLRRAGVLTVFAVFNSIL